MQIFSVVALALGLANHAIGAAVTSNAARAVGEESHVIQVNGIDVTVTTGPVPKDRLSALTNTTLGGRSPVPETTLTKRTVNNCCTYGCSRTCRNDLSTSSDPPAQADCDALKSYLQTLASNALVGQSFPCNLPNQASCPNFTVSPGQQRAYSVGTCVVRFININPTGGADEKYCFYLMAGIITSSYNDCVTTQAMTGAHCEQSLATGYRYALEVAHV